jgi:hypothetical protein
MVEGPSRATLSLTKKDWPFSFHFFHFTFFLWNVRKCCWKERKKRKGAERRMVYRVKEILQLLKEPIDIFFCFTIVNKGWVTRRPCPFTLISILRQKKNSENSNISPCKNIISKNTLKETKILQDIIITLY